MESRGSRQTAECKRRQYVHTEMRGANWETRGIGQQGLKWRGEKTIKLGNGPCVKSLGMGKIGFSLDYYFILDILDARQS